jgi:hypothetical protein
VFYRYERRLREKPNRRPRSSLRMSSAVPDEMLRSVSRMRRASQFRARDSSETRPSGTDRTRSRGVSDPLRTGRGVRHRAEQGGRSRLRCIRGSSIDERLGRHRAPSRHVAECAASHCERTFSEPADTTPASFTNGNSGNQGEDVRGGQLATGVLSPLLSPAPVFSSVGVGCQTLDNVEYAEGDLVAG